MRAGLFQKAIGESGAFFGGGFRMSPMAERAKTGPGLGGSLGAKNLAELRALPAEKFLDAAKKSPSGVCAGWWTASF